MEWIKVTEDSPSVEQRVLAFWNEDRMEGAARDDEGTWYYLQDGDTCSLIPTHFVPLPNPPME